MGIDRVSTARGNPILLFAHLATTHRRAPLPTYPAVARCNTLPHFAPEM